MLSCYKSISIKRAWKLSIRCLFHHFVTFQESRGYSTSCVIRGLQ